LASINMTELRGCPFPLPPLAEQRRIVARVEELRRLCAQMREKLTQAREVQARLADALVARANA
jgi:type I restriction enzyme S subunit